MGTLYMAAPKTSHAVADIATGTSVKTLLQVATPSTTDIRIHGWGISFEGTSSSAAPGHVVLGDFDVAATVTSLTPELWESADAQASLCVGGTSATGYNGTAEGTIGGSRFLDVQHVHPQSGYAVWWPEARHPRVKASRFLRIRCTFAADVNALPWIVWEEPA